MLNSQRDLGFKVWHFVNVFREPTARNEKDIPDNTSRVQPLWPDGQFVAVRKPVGHLPGCSVDDAARSY